MARDPKATSSLHRPFSPFARARAALLFVALVAPVLLVLPAGAASATTVPGVLPAISVKDVCRSAAKLTKEGHWEDALTLITELRKDKSQRKACRSVRLHAYVASARESLEVEPAPDKTTTDLLVERICRLSRQLIDNDEPERAVTLINDLRSATPDESATECESQRLLALWKTARPDKTPPTVAERSEKSWTSAIKKWLLPLAGIMTAIVAVVAVALIAARLLALLTPNLTTSRFVPEIKSPKKRSRRQAGGLLAIIAGSVAIVAGICLIATSLLLAGIVVALAVFVLIVGTCVLASAIASILALSITVHDTKGGEDKARKSAVVAHLAALGSNQPTGVQVQQATDVTALAESALPSSANPVLAAIKSVFAALAGNTPWSVAIDTVSDTRVAVLISRNGRSLSSALIDTERWKELLGTSTLDADKFAAAAILTVLSEHYEDFEGLNGATRWESIGLHYIATSDYRDDPAKMIQLLSAALNEDSANLAAAVALKQVLYRRSAKQLELYSYSTWLMGTSDAIVDECTADAQKQQKKGYLDLHRRLLVNFLIAAINLKSTKPGADSEEVVLDPISVNLHAARLRELVAPGTPESGGFRVRVERFIKQPMEHIAILYPNVNPSKNPHAARFASPDALGSTRAYNAACKMVADGARMDSSDLGQVAGLKELFRIAFLDASHKAWAREDPSLEALHDDPQFAQLVSLSDVTTSWDLAPFADLKSKLTLIGVATPAQIYLRDSDPSLRFYLGISESRYRNVVDSSKLVQAAQMSTWADPASAASQAMLEILVELFALGITQPSDIRTEWIYPRNPQDKLPDDPSVIEEIKENIYTRTWRTVKLRALARWLRAVRENGEQLESVAGTL